MSNLNLACVVDPTKHLKKIAIVDADSHVSYQQLENLSNLVAHSLVQQGVEPKDRVAIKIENGIDLVIALLGVLKIGAVAVMINSNAPLQQQTHMISSNKACCVIDNLDWLNRSTVVDFQVYKPEPDDLAVIMYTSGTTAFPKAVMISHNYKQGILKNTDTNNQFMSTQRILTASPFTQGAGFFQIFFSLLIHATVVIQKKFDAKQFIQLICKYRITHIMCAPTVLKLVLQHQDFLKNHDLSTVTTISLSSSPVNKKLLDSAKKNFPQAKIFNNYGCTELGPKLFTRPNNKEIPELSVGCEQDYIKYRLNQGVLEIKSPYMSQNCNNTTEDGYYITNDLFEVDNQGCYYFLGRVDDMFTCGGNNVYPSQVESVLEKHPAVDQAVVVGIEDDIKGHMPYAFVVVNSTITEDKLKRFVLEHLLPVYCPRKIWITDHLPISNVSNKINKSILIEKAKSLLAMNLKGKTAVVIGAAGGVGWAVVKKLAEAGCQVTCVVRRNPEDLKHRLQQLSGHSTVVHQVFEADARDSASLDRVRDQLSQCDILVNCAGKSQPIAHGDLDSLTDEIFDQTMIDNLRSTFATMRAFLPLLKSSSDAVIVNIGSTAAQGTGGSNLAYAAAKAGIECLTRKLAPVIAPVRIFTVCPGALNTGWLPRPPDFEEQVAKGTPLGRIGTAEDVANTVYACITALKFATGQSLLIDGGRTV